MAQGTIDRIKEKLNEMERDEYEILRDTLRLEELEELREVTNKLFEAMGE